MAAKLYTEKQEPRVVRVWQEGEICWIAWQHTVNLVIDPECLDKLTTHAVEVRVWDDKVRGRHLLDRFATYSQSCH